MRNLKNLSIAEMDIARKQLLEEVQVKIQETYTYMSKGSLDEDINYLISVAKHKDDYDFVKIKEAIGRIKRHLFGSPMLDTLIIPDSFYNSTIGAVIRSLEAGVTQEESLLSVSFIMDELNWTRRSVLNRLYVSDEEGLSAKDTEGKMPAMKTSNGYLVYESAYYEWKDKYFLSKKGKRT
jgi:hypothetical protein